MTFKEFLAELVDKGLADDQTMSLARKLSSDVGFPSTQDEVDMVKYVAMRLEEDEVSVYQRLILIWRYQEGFETHDSVDEITNLHEMRVEGIIESAFASKRGMEAPSRPKQKTKPRVKDGVILLSASEFRALFKLAVVGDRLLNDDLDYAQDDWSDAMEVIEKLAQSARRFGATDLVKKVRGEYRYELRNEARSEFDEAFTEGFSLHVQSLLAVTFAKRDTEIRARVAALAGKAFNWDEIYLDSAKFYLDELAKEGALERLELRPERPNGHK